MPIRKNSFLLPLCILLALCAAGFIAYSPQVLEAARAAAEVALKTLLPSIFPFMVITDMLQRCCFALTANSKKRFFFSMMFSFLGGFACGARMVCNMTREGILSPKSAAYALCGAINSGPAFVICAVGTGMLQSTEMGICIYASLCVASLLSLLLFSRRLCVLQGSPHEVQPSFSDSLFHGLRGIAGVCGVSILFSCILASMRAAFLFGDTANLLLNIGFDVTSACVVASQMTAAPYLCCAAISLVSAMVVIQISVQTSSCKISLLPLLLSRLLHTPLSLGILYLLLRVSEQLQATGLFRGVPAEITAAAPPVFTLLLFLALMGVAAKSYP